MKRLVIFLHRYLGIPMSVVFVVWFVSGIVMIYTKDMPALGDADRLRGQGAIDLDAIALSPAEALQRAGAGGTIMQAGLGNLLGRPAYRFGRTFGPDITVFADTGERFDGTSPAEARAAVADFVGEPIDSVRHVETVSSVDQWTIALARSLPLERFRVADGRGTEIYFSTDSGQVMLETTRGTRTLAWLGAIPHWFYFTPLRTNQPVWYWTVVWVAAAGIGLATLGLILAVTQFRRSRPFRLSASIRYRGWMRWHYYTGALFGVFALTWVFSGMLSMEPFGWTSAQGMDLPDNDLAGGELELERYAIAALGDVAGLDARAIYEIELERIQGEPYFLARTLPATAAVSASPSSSGPVVERRLVDAARMQLVREPFAAESILQALEATVSGVRIVEHAVLDRYDSYYYAQANAAPLPVLRVKFDDPAETWYYFDLLTSRPIAANHRLSRLERWLFNGLHSLDFPFWYDRRPLWDIGMIVLSLGALATSSIGLYLGFRRLLGFPARAAAGRPPARSDI